MKRAVLCMLAMAASASLAFGSTRIIPIAGHLPGGNDTMWTTDVSLTNSDASANSVAIVFHPEDGIARSRTVTLAGGQSILLSDAVKPESFGDSNPESWLGQLEIRSSGNVSASARIFTPAPTGGTYGSTYDSFDPSVLSNGGAIPGLINSARFRSNIAFADPGDAAASITYVIRREDGSVVTNNRLDVPAHSSRQFSLSRDVSSSADDSRLLLEWSSTVPAYGVGSVIDNRSGDPTNAPSTAWGHSTLFFPVVGKTPGGLSTFWTTSASFSSRSDVAGNVTMAYRDNATRQLFMKTVPIPARGTIRTDDLNVYLGAPNGSGSLTVISTVRIAAAVRVFNTRTDDSTYGSGVQPQESAVSSSHVRINGVRRDFSYRLNVAISDDSNTTDGTVRLLDDHGSEVESETFHLEHGAAVQVSMSHTQREIEAGEIEVETHNGASVTVVASNIDNRTGDTVVHEAEQENERQHELEIRISPSTATVGAAIAFSIGDSTSITSINWNFGDTTTATSASVNHAYASAGEYEVTAEATLANGAIVRAREDVHVLGAGGGTTTGPVDFSWSPASPAVGQEVTFTASGPTDGGSFAWKFPGGITTSGSIATFTFAAAGSYEVELELEHEGATTLHATHNVTVGGGSTGGTTSIDFSWTPLAPAAGQQVTFTASGNANGGTFVWVFPGDVRVNGSVATFTFIAAGSYEVELELEHEGSTTLHTTHIVNVGGSTGGGTTATSVDFSFSPSPPHAGQTVTFTATADREPGSGSTYKWRFPDDSRPLGKSVAYTFPASGVYAVRVQLEQPGQVSIEREKDVTVLP